MPLRVFPILFRPPSPPPPITYAFGKILRYMYKQLLKSINNTCEIGNEIFTEKKMKYDEKMRKLAYEAGKMSNFFFRLEG